jgi:hypothetical protein
MKKIISLFFLFLSITLGFPGIAGNGSGKFPADGRK